MKVYIMLNSEIKNLIVEGTLQSNHKSQVWRLLNVDTSYVGFVSNHFDILECSESILSEHIRIGNYLVEVEVEEEDILTQLAYSDYLKLSTSSTIHTVNQVTELLTRANRIINSAPVLAIIFKNLTVSKISRVFRYSGLETSWVECEIRDSKLHHKVK